MHSELNSLDLAGTNRTNMTLARAVKNQYIYKLRVYSGYFCTLILMQVIALFFSLSGTMSVMSSSYTYHEYSALFVVLFSEFWALVVAVLLSTRQRKNEAFALPGNRLSDCLSDIAYMLTGCLLGGVTSALAGIALRIPIYFLHPGLIMLSGFYPDPREIFTIFASTALYMLLLSATGYLCGVLVHLSKVFYAIIPALIFGAILLENNSSKSRTLFRICWDSVINAHSLSTFAAWVTILSVLLLAAGTIISYRVEVKR